MIKRAELEYFGGMTNVQMTQVGVERIANEPLPCGVTACAHTKDLSFFAVASLSGYITLFSSKDLSVKGVALAGSPVVDLQF